MPRRTPDVLQVAGVTGTQIVQFKRDGFIVLPRAIDPGLCRRARDQMWDTIATHRPNMQRGDPSTWMPFTKEETASYLRPAEGPSGGIWGNWSNEARAVPI